MAPVRGYGPGPYVYWGGEWVIWILLLLVLLYAFAPHFRLW